MNTPYFRGSNEENAMATSPLAPPPTNTIHATPNRRVLGEVSTNPRVYSSPATGGLFGSRKIMMGSPLKRSFTAAVEDGYGLKYLKSRRGSGEFGFGEVGGRGLRREGDGTGAGTGAGLRARSVPEAMATLPEPADESLLYSPTEPNTPSDSGGETHDSFASLINFDPSSQHIVGNSQSRHHHHHQHEQQHQQQQQIPHFLQDHAQLPPPPHFPPPQQQQQPSGLIFPTVSHAETLRLRLQVAMYKIRTNQVNVPFAELQIEGEQRSAEEEANRNRHRVNEAVEAAVATMRREAMDNMPRSTGPPPLLIPGPLLHPTAYSSRMVEMPEPQQQQQQQQQQHQHFDLGPLAAAGLYMSDQQTQGGNMMPDM